jgi:hypothetical protein
MPFRQLNVVYSALVLNRVSYCLSAWGGFLNSEQIGRINALFKRAVKYGFVEHVYDFDGLLVHADRKLFENIQCDSHCLNRFFQLQTPIVSDYVSGGTITSCLYVIIIYTEIRFYHAVYMLFMT